MARVALDGDRDDARFSLTRRVGRVIEARVFWLRTPEAATRYTQALAAEVARAPRNMQPVLCADHRPVAIYSQPVADRLTELFVDMNRRLARVAILVARTNATLSLQLSRIVREAGNPNRKLFHDATDALAHLSPVLDQAERIRVENFLAELPPEPPR
jgi:hypothetical protein